MELLIPLRTVPFHPQLGGHSGESEWGWGVRQGEGQGPPKQFVNRNEELMECLLAMVLDSDCKKSI